MKAAIFYGPRDIRVDEVPDPRIKSQDEAIVKITHSCICGSDLWSFRGLSARNIPSRIGHEFMGIVESVGKKVKKVKPGDFVISPFSIGCGVCPECMTGTSGSCRNLQGWGSGDLDACQGEKVRVPHADYMLFVVPKSKLKDSLIPSLLTLSDVFCTGYHAAISAGVDKNKAVAVIGDGAVGLCAVASAKILGAKKIILMSTHADRAKIGKKLGATEIVAVRGEKAKAAVRKLTKDAGADCVLECVGNKSSWQDALAIVKKGGRIGWVGVPHEVELIDMASMFPQNIGIMGGRASAAAYIPKLLPLVLSGKVNPGLVFTKTIKLDDIQKGYEAMDSRREIKVMIKL
ncbi:MAG TPA: zinc-binding dehydrogenase [Patescibacteria group bacterium]|nr:zinc-binding dehydrogenase [Patescibacteria group bacterium]